MAPAVAARPAYLLSVALVVFSAALSALTQPSLTAEGGLGWDGAQYTLLASQCWREPLQALEPFAYRIGAPCLAALLPVPPRTGLQIVNVASSAFLLVMLAAWLRPLVARPVVPWLLVGFAFHWLTPLRQVWWYPTYIDPPALCAIVGALLLMHRPLGFALVCLLGTFIRETVLVVPVSLAVGRMIAHGTDATGRGWRSAGRDPEVRSAAFGTIAGVAAIAITHKVVTPASDYWMADAALYWAYKKALPSFVLAWFVAFGPALALVVAGWSDVRHFLVDAPEYAVMLVAVAVLAWVGGSDTERFLLWGSPIVVAMIGRAASGIDWSRARGPLALLAAGQIINGRWFWTTPATSVEGPRDWPLLTPWSAHRVEDLLSLTPDRLVSAASLAQYAVLAIAIVAWLRHVKGEPH